MSLKKLQQKGFTLVELLVVIAIIAILGVVAIAAINPIAKINAANDAKAMANVTEIGKAFEACLTEKMSVGGLTTQSAAADACCLTGGAAGTCLGSTLNTAGYGFAGGWAGATVNRSATGVVCASQAGGTTGYLAKYVTGTGNVVTSGTACASGV